MSVSTVVLNLAMWFWGFWTKFEGRRQKGLEMRTNAALECYQQSLLVELLVGVQETRLPIQV